ncbi:hypothetical protein C0991_011320 [Blastosporella zonata]|nr:hypothetical protein C0991_011320 [Blastosporella zonata]
MFLYTLFERADMHKIVAAAAKNHSTGSNHLNNEDIYNPRSVAADTPDEAPAARTGFVGGEILDTHSNDVEKIDIASEKPDEHRDDRSSNLGEFVYVSTPRKSESITYSFGTPASSRASPIRDINLTSLPIRPDLDAVLRHVVEDINFIDQQDRADLQRIIMLGKAAMKLLSHAEALRRALRAERGNRERLENYVSTWKKVSPGWSLRDVYSGEYLLEATAQGGMVGDMEGRPMEVDIEDIGDATCVEALYPVEPGSIGPFIKRYRDPVEQKASGRDTPSPNTGSKRSREDDGDGTHEEESRYRQRSRSQEPVPLPKETTE